MTQRLTATLPATILAISLDVCVALPGQAGSETRPDAEMPSPPGLEFEAVRASRLHLGMAESEVVAIMGQAAQTTEHVEGSVAMRILDFPAGPIPSKVTLSNGRLSGVALDPFRIDEADITHFTNRAWPGLARAAVVRALGTPSEVRHHAFFGIALDQLIFRRSGEPEVSLFFVDNYLVAKKVGVAIPADIFRVVLPSPPDPTGEEPVETAVEVGMKASDVKALYAPAKFITKYRFNGQPAEYAIYQTRPSGPYVSFTFVDGVLTEFADVGRLPDDATFQGR